MTLRALRQTGAVMLNQVVRIDWISHLALYFPFGYPFNEQRTVLLTRVGSRHVETPWTTRMRLCFMKALKGKPLDGPTVLEVLLKNDRSGWSGSLAYISVRFALRFDADGIWFARRLNDICNRKLDATHLRMRPCDAARAASSGTRWLTTS